MRFPKRGKSPHVWLDDLHKRCGRCHEFKHITEFYNEVCGRRSCYCKECNRTLHFLRREGFICQ